MSQIVYVSVPTSRDRLSKRIRDTLAFKFHQAFPEAAFTTNGLCYNGVYLPEEVVEIILSHVDIDDILNCSLVCKKWCNIIKSHGLWAQKYHRKYNKKPKRLPWYVFFCLFSTNWFDVNLLKNGNGQEGFKHWTICWYTGEFVSDRYSIEDPPLQTDPLPENVPEFNGSTSCFVISYQRSRHKYQEISFAHNKLMIYVVNHFKPHIYLSEWVAGKYDCFASYRLRCVLRTDDEPERPYDADDLFLYGSIPFYMQRGLLDEKELELDVEGGKWQQVEMVVTDYWEGVDRMLFQHGRCVFQHKDNFGSCKVAGGVLKLLFESIEEQSM